jgi:hypothetical protein
VRTLSLFVAFWVCFFYLYQRFPYVKNGSTVVFNAKLRQEAHGPIFPADRSVVRVLIFGNSKILAGFMPSVFDQMASDAKLKVSSFNSGFPGSDLVLPPLKEMCARGQAPNVLLLTLPWRADPPRRGIFRFILDDHDVIQAMFPFRSMASDVTSFLVNAPQHGGVLSYYREAEKDEKSVIVNRGYYLVSEQDHFPGGRVPDDFHLASDQPHTILNRGVGPRGVEIAALDRLITQYRIRCYYVPYYYRIGEAALQPGPDQQSAALVEQLTPCKVLGSDYYLYPNKLFADQTHLNGAGAEAYTQALFHLLEGKLSPG